MADSSVSAFFGPPINRYQSVGQPLVETGVLQVLFNEAASWGLVRSLFLKLDTNVLVLLLSCALGPPTLSILVRASLRCSVKRVVHSVVRALQFLGNFSHGIAFISQNKNRLTSFRRNIFVSGHFEPVIKPTWWCSRYSNSLKKASVIASLNQNNSFQLC